MISFSKSVSSYFANKFICIISFSVQFSFSVVSSSLQPHELEHARPPCPSPTPGVPQTHVHRVSDAIRHLILCRPLLLLPPIPPSSRVFSNESTLHVSWPSYWSFSLGSFLPKNTQDWPPSEWTGWISLQSKGLSRVFSNTTVQKHQFLDVMVIWVKFTHFSPF